MKSLHVSSFTLDLLHLDALPETDRQRVEQHLVVCPECRLAAESARASREAFARHVLPKGVPRPQRRRSWVPWLALSSALAAAALLLVVRSRPPDISIKGAPTLAAFARRAGQVTAVHDEDQLRAGDELRFVVVSERLPYLLVCSVDGAGKASIYFPFDGGESGRIDVRSRVELPGSIVLDDAPGPERVFALFSAEPMAAAQVDDVLRAIGRQGDAAIRGTKELPLTAGAQASVLFEKAH
jgi:Putative zinc-finger